MIKCRIKKFLLKIAKKQEQENFKKMTGYENKEELSNSCIKGTPAYERKEFAKVIIKMNDDFIKNVKDLLNFMKNN